MSGDPTSFTPDTTNHTGHGGHVNKPSLCKGEPRSQVYAGHAGRVLPGGGNEPPLIPLPPGPQAVPRGSTQILGLRREEPQLEEGSQDKIPERPPGVIEGLGPCPSSWFMGGGGPV